MDDVLSPVWLILNGVIVVATEEFEPWVDPIPVNVVNEDEPLFRIRFTKLHKTGQMIYASCWLHALGRSYEPISLFSVDVRAKVTGTWPAFSGHTFLIFIADLAQHHSHHLL